MKKRQYFPLEVNMINGDSVSKLIEELGPKGFGVYIMVLTELRHSTNYRCTLTALKGMARRCKISKKLLTQVMSGFQLFEVNKEEADEIIASPYLDRVMGEYEEKCRKLSDAAVKRNNKFKRDENGQFTDTIGVIEKNRIEKNKTTTAVVNKPDDNSSWEKHLDDAVKDEVWMELLAMNSGFGQLFVRNQKEVVEAFRRHVRLQGTGVEIVSARDVKAYFANFLRQGTPTQKRVAEQLARSEKERENNSVNRYETIDPITGERSYYGNRIPPTAPPRPNHNAVWSKELHAWI